MKAYFAFGWLKASDGSAKFYREASRAQLLRALKRAFESQELGLSSWCDAACRNVTGGRILPGDAIRYIRGTK